MATATQPSPDNPYATAQAYRSAGWIGTIPIPLGVKWPPPSGFTGEDGEWPSGADVAAWLEDGPRNIALRLPPNVIALDVDVVAAFAELMEKVGPLPPTWRAHSGGDRLGHFYYRLPPGITSKGWGAPCEGVDLLRYGHRYSVVWPSVHPSGTQYGWAPPPGWNGGDIPWPGDLPELPAEWVAHLSGERRAEGTGSAGTLPAPGELGSPIPEGEHDATITAYVWSLRHRVSETEAIGLARARGRDCVPPTWTDAMSDAKVRYAYRREVEPEPVWPAWEEALAADAIAEVEAKARAIEEAERDPLALVDWHEVWAMPQEDEWLVPGLVPARRGVALYSAPKVGKSLLVLEMAVALSLGQSFLGEPTEPARVLYVDHENDLRGDVRSRLIGMGYGPDDLKGLRYLSMPAMGPLDSSAGAAQLLEVATREEVDLVVLDTVSRTVAGEENANDTWLAFYRHTGRALKRAGIAYLRLDHSGKDDERGMRGGSAKSGDVDLVWRMVKKEEDEFLLICDANRLPVPATVVGIHRATSPRLTHVVSTKSTDSDLRRRGDYLAFILEQNYPALPGYRVVAADLRAAGHKVSDELVKALLRDLRRAEEFRRETARKVAEGGSGPVDNLGIK